MTIIDTKMHRSENNCFVLNEHNFLTSVGKNFEKLFNYEKVACVALGVFFGFNIAKSIIVYSPLVPLGLVACAYLTVVISTAAIIGNILSGIAEQRRAHHRLNHPYL